MEIFLCEPLEDILNYKIFLDKFSLLGKKVQKTVYFPPFRMILFNNVQVATEGEA